MSTDGMAILFSKKNPETAKIAEVFRTVVLRIYPKATQKEIAASTGVPYSAMRYLMRGEPRSTANAAEWLAKVAKIMETDYDAR